MEIKFIMNSELINFRKSNLYRATTEYIRMLQFNVRKPKVSNAPNIQDWLSFFQSALAVMPRTHIIVTVNVCLLKCISIFASMSL
jgi:hypothetical protein